MDGDCNEIIHQIFAFHIETYFANDFFVIEVVKSIENHTKNENKEEMQLTP